MKRIHIFVAFLLIMLGAVLSHCSHGRRNTREIRYCSGTLNNIKYCQYQVGDYGTNIVISAPHGGGLRPTSIKTRHDGCYINNKCVWSHTCGVRNRHKCGASVVKDTYTKEMSILLADLLQEATGRRPHLIINDLHRSKMDGNRGIAPATFGEPEAVTAFNEFHGFIKDARNAVLRRGLFIDMHGQTHASGLNELGYLISKTRLNNNNADPDISSIRYLANLVPCRYTFDDVMRGKDSLGTYLQKEGYDTVPSLTHYSPGTSKYFRGGYNTRMYGSLSGGMIDGVQVETHKQYRNSAKAPKYIKALSRAIVKFMRKYRY